MSFMMFCDGMKPPITSGGGGGGLQWPNKTLSGVFGIFNAAGPQLDDDASRRTRTPSYSYLLPTYPLTAALAQRRGLQGPSKVQGVACAP